MENRFGTFGANDSAYGPTFTERLSEPGNELIVEHNTHITDVEKHVTALKQEEWDKNTTDIAALDTRMNNKEIPNTATLTAAGWSGTAPYTQTVAVAGITAGRLPDKIIPQYSATTATAILQKEAYSMISFYDTGAGTIAFTCLEDKPTVDIPLQIVGV